MPNKWHKTRRSIEKDYKFYHTPREVWRNINSRTWPYKKRVIKYQVRDLAYMCLMYLSTCRASELCRATLEAGRKLSVKKNQFTFDGDFIRFRNVIVLKRREPVYDANSKPIFDSNGRQKYRAIQSLEDYPVRVEIPLPLEGGGSIFTGPIVDHLENLTQDEELFKFHYPRGWQIVEHCTYDKENKRGEMQHYLRDMGIKHYSRLLNRNIADLQEFTGHARVENLVKYLGEGNLEKRMLEARW